MKHNSWKWWALVKVWVFRLKVFSQHQIHTWNTLQYLIGEIFRCFFFSIKYFEMFIVYILFTIFIFDSWIKCLTQKLGEQYKQNQNIQSTKQHRNKRWNKIGNKNFERNSQYPLFAGKKSIDTILVTAWNVSFLVHSPVCACHPLSIVSTSDAVYKSLSG